MAIKKKKRKAYSYFLRNNRYNRNIFKLRACTNNYCDLRFFFSHEFDSRDNRSLMEVRTVALRDTLNFVVIVSILLVVFYSFIFGM